MICIEEWGGEEPEGGGSVGSAALDPISAGPFALRLRLGASFARENGVCGVRRWLDVAVAQVAAADTDLERNNRIYFASGRGGFFLPPCASGRACRGGGGREGGRWASQILGKIRYFAPAACPPGCNRLTKGRIPRCSRSSCSPETETRFLRTFYATLRSQDAAGRLARGYLSVRSQSSVGYFFRWPPDQVYRFSLEHTADLCLIHGFSISRTYTAFSLLWKSWISWHTPGKLLYFLDGIGLKHYTLWYCYRRSSFFVGESRACFDSILRGIHK